MKLQCVEIIFRQSLHGELTFQHYCKTSSVISTKTLGVDSTGDRSYPPWNHAPPQAILVPSCLQ